MKNILAWYLITGLAAAVVIIDWETIFPLTKNKAWKVFLRSVLIVLLWPIAILGILGYAWMHAVSNWKKRIFH